MRELINGGLVVEGGGTRGIYAAGVMDFFIDENIYFSNCYGVSAGSCHCCSYLSGQKGRAKDVFVEYINDNRYASFRNLIKTGDYFGKDFSLKTIPDELLPYDYEAYENQNSNFYAVATNVETGKAEYLKLEDMHRDIDYVWASSSLPLMSRIVEIGDKKYLDGGVADSIPVLKSIEDGNKKTVLILTREKEYRKEPNKLISVIRMKYKAYPNFVKAMEERHIVYNQTLDKINELENEGKIFVFRPKTHVSVGRIEKNKEVLMALYQQGYDDAKELHGKLMEYLET